VQKQIAEWNTDLKLWGNSKTDLLSEQWEPFLETWQTWGMTQNGVAYELPMPELPTIVLESSLLRSPTASQGQGGALGEAEARKRGNTVGIRDQAMDLAKLQGHKVSRQVANLPTPTVSDQYTGNLASTQQKPGSMHSVTLAQVFHKPELFPTPTTRDYKDGSEPHKREGKVQTDTVARAVFNSGQISQTKWGKFEPAIRRWETILARVAPQPTKADGKDGNHRLSSDFTEWMMGLDDGWITGHGLKRNEELKLAGNGVVPQQAELALRILLGGQNE
jgi:DNA (cytosine-5)-methyltransferase 1